MAIEITSETPIDIEHHFRVSAGPGAGKTHWLALHVGHVLRESKRLGKMGRVACLSYTNVGADTLLGRLTDSRSRVQSCTIHSFLYAYIVRPYLHFIAAEEGFNMSELTGEDDRILSDYKTIEKVLKAVGQEYADQDMVASAIRTAKWRMQEDGELNCIAVPKRKCAKKGSYILKDEAYGVYKRLAWAKGYMHYDDVLYFSYKLIRKYPFVCKVLAIQFPYVFVDEFQDTNPIQAYIIRQIGEKGAIVGVIGDYAQSIYSFLGADPSQFVGFALEGLQDYEIKDNRRSTNEVVALLNTIRPDFQQRALRNVARMRPMLVVGELLRCYEVVQEIAGGEVHALSYRNVEANMLKQQVNAHVENSQLINQITDSNVERREFVAAWIRAIEHARSKQYGAAFKMLAAEGVKDEDAYSSLKETVDEYGTYCDGTLYGFYEYLAERWEMANMKTGTAIYRFYTGHTYRQLSQCVGLQEDSSEQRTVHKAKGDEFENVLVIFTDEKGLKVLHDPNIQGWEPDRVYYVAMSRARERLFLTVPALTPPVRRELRKLPLDIKNVEELEKELLT